MTQRPPLGFEILEIRQPFQVGAEPCCREALLEAGPAKLLRLSAADFRMGYIGNEATTVKATIIKVSSSVDFLDNAASGSS